MKKLVSILLAATLIAPLVAQVPQNQADPPPKKKVVKKKIVLNPGDPPPPSQP